MSKRVAIVPQPASLILLEGDYALLSSTRIFSVPAFYREAEYLAGKLRRATGFPFVIHANSAAPKDAPAIELILDANLHRLGKEGFQLEIEGDSIKLKSSAPVGIFYAIQTLLQLMPLAVFDERPRPDVDWTLPRVRIEDSPRFAWRGAMLDCGRHFMPVEFLRKFIDLLALHKLNVFHWHLTEDQGWRIEIKKYPRLTEVGAWRRETTRGHVSANLGGDGIPHGGLYSQDEARELVAYATERHITIIPEIEMPGHAQAAIAAYPELGCTSEKLDVGTRWGVIENILNPSEKTFTFMQDVLSEVIALFSSPFIHVGGDEAVKKQWDASPAIRARMTEVGAHDAHELQSYFIRRIDQFLSEQGRRLIGWDEILEGGLAPGATVMSWRGVKGGIEAARAGHDVIMAPNTHTYLDAYQSADPANEPLAIGGQLPLEKVLSYEPIPDTLSPDQARHILGIQGQLWTEYMPTPRHVEYMAFPRLCALAEVGWSSPGTRQDGSFLERLHRHLKRLDLLGVKYRSLDG
jgi:hexosaminidase